MADGDITRTCSIDGCTRPHRARGYCAAHWTLWRKYGDPTRLIGAGPLPDRCAAPGCGRKPHSRWRGGGPYCNKHYLRMLANGSLEALGAPVAPLIGQCTVPGCANFRRSGRAKLCEMHYYRVRRKGTTADREQPGPQRTRSGYVLVKADHPLAASNGWAYQHRLVAYEACGGECPPCHWCAGKTTWASCHVDHLNGVKADNRAENLVIACARCNRTRGSAWPFLLALTDGSLEHLLSLLRADRQGASKV
jgi:hypothetical protein